ncbi:hypothetical protein [Jiangella asiatica]|uniref:DUF4352 domain-containing protein n=1 Tax=Jiangella asiatica TaxID=2530372 RepID=A0A4V6PFM5_9ACTN|nr:hypothetical protein [Jiangella asiatica]TDE09508.1 hypothetical protein E1269_14435 [Jiangella asiatica]
MSHGWWRRNRLALPAMVLALGALAWPASEPAREQWWPNGEHVVHSPGADGWAAVDGIELRLAEFGPAEAPGPDDPLPAGHTVWRAEIEGTPATQSVDCDTELEDTEGSRYGDDSRHLPLFDDDTFGLTCGGPEPGGVVYFMLPDDREPSAVRVRSIGTLPDYWLLPTG